MLKWNFLGVSPVHTTKEGGLCGLGRRPISEITRKESLKRGGKKRLDGRREEMGDLRFLDIISFTAVASDTKTLSQNKGGRRKTCSAARKLERDFGWGIRHKLMRRSLKERKVEVRSGHSSAGKSCMTKCQKGQFVGE